MAKISVTTDKMLKISLPDEDTSSTDMLDFAVHSGFDYPKMEEDFVGYFTYTFAASPSTGTTTIKTVTHNLGYKPMSIAFIGDILGSGTFARLPIPVYDFSFQSFRAYTTTTQFIIEVGLDDSFDVDEVKGKTFKFKYQIWVND